MGDNIADRSVKYVLVKLTIDHEIDIHPDSVIESCDCIFVSGLPGAEITETELVEQFDEYPFKRR